MADLPTEDDLKKLPLRAVVAFAVRCAERLRPLFNLPNDSHQQSVDRAILVAKGYAETGTLTSNSHSASVDAFVAAKAAVAAAGLPAVVVAQTAYAAVYATSFDADKSYASASDASASAARKAAVYAAHEADSAVYSSADAAAILDYEALSELAEDTLPDVLAIDFSALGPLWHGDEPEWFRNPPPWTGDSSDDDKAAITVLGESSIELSPETLEQVEASNPEPLISAYFNDSGFTRDEKLLALQYLGELYRECGGSGLKIVDGKTLVPEREAV